MTPAAVKLPVAPELPGLFKVVKALRMAGFAAWRRGEVDSFTPRLHAIAIGDRSAAQIAKDQVGSAGDMHLARRQHRPARAELGALLTHAA
jgi:hypothetical protein